MLMARESQRRINKALGVFVVLSVFLRYSHLFLLLSFKGANNAESDVPKDQQLPQAPVFCSECLDIIQRMNFTNTSFVPVAHIHSHLGAVDQFGVAGYVHDVTALRRNPPRLNMTQEYIAKECLNQDDDFRMIKERFVIDFAYEQEMQQSKKPRPRLLCVIYTVASGHGRIQNIRETWGQKCDGLLVASDTADPSVDSVKILHKGKEDYGNMWQKVRSMWEYIYDNYYSDYDFYHMGGDDMFVIVENLRRYLESDEIRAAQNGGMLTSEQPEEMQIPLYLGERYKFNGDGNDIYNTGGPGYTLNRAAVKTLVVDGLPYHFTDVKSSMEDVFVARVLKILGVDAYQTRDEYRGERYMHFAPSWYYNFTSTRIDWMGKFYIDPVEGFNHSSPYSVSFHYMKDEMMKRAHSLLYYQCPETNR
ncbi:hypothetical protein MPSEU_000017400 [Mayamaea pseudoterrestris]|nr:hypothetical protein MPSEU_000017400 [Mayamaea pseudoterrestris]